MQGAPANDGHIIRLQKRPQLPLNPVCSQVGAEPTQELNNVHISTSAKRMDFSICSSG